LMLLTGILTLSQGALLIFHIFLLFTNSTTIECVLRFAGIYQKTNPYYVGIMQNIEEVFGRWKLSWPIPVAPMY